MMFTRCEAAALRYVHDVVTGDFVTVGVVLACPDRHFLGARFATELRKVKAAFPTADVVHLRRVFKALESACEGWARRNSEELRLERSGCDFVAGLRALVPEDGTLQFSPATSGVTQDPKRTLEDLFERYVGAISERPSKVGRSGEDVWRTFSELLPEDAVKKLRTWTVKSARFEWEFRHAWKNGTWHAVQPVSFDTLEPHAIKDKAAVWSGRLLALRPREQGTEIKLLVGMPSRDRPRLVRDAARDGLAILGDLQQEAQVVPEADARFLATKMVDDLALH